LRRAAGENIMAKGQLRKNKEAKKPKKDKAAAAAKPGAGASIVSTVKK
jgi:hypothetical protein